MFRPFFLFIGARYTNFKRRDHFITFISIVSMVGIALGVMVLITVLSVMNGFTKEIRSRILSITPHVMVAGWGENLQNWPVLADQLSKHKDVEAVGPYIDGQGMLTRGREVRGIVVKGVDPKAIDAVFPLKSTLKVGKVDELQEGSFHVIIGSHLAKTLGVNIGDTVTLVIPEVTVSMAGVAPRLKRLTVVGIFEVGYIYDSGFVFMNIQDAAKIFKTQGGVTGLQLRLDDPFAAPRIAKEIYNQTHGHYNVVDWTLLNSTYFSAVKMEKTMMFFTLIMILAIAVFNLISTLVMIVTDKRADIGVLRALGASTRKIMAIFISQGAIIGFIGTMLGVVAGVALALNVTDLVAALEQTFRVKFLSADVYFISFLPSDLQTQDVLLIGVCAMVLSLLATIHPAWRAANVQPAEALRHDA
ncbi:MAG: lipoprotein-releasing ABC transporter permease subunit [Gammaproteobacteria bacterium]|nr:lipoprotein-releasing ABC transporter permease subunit [Gammaproteobacteria bacterium]